MTASATSAPACRVDQFLRALRACFAQAAGRLPVHRRRIALAGGGVSLDIAGDAVLDSVLPALAHLPAGVGPTGLRVRVFDSASSGIGLPPPPWDADAVVSRGEVHGLGNARVRLAFQPGSSVLSLYEPGTGDALVWMRDAAHCPAWERAAPLRTVLHWWCAEQGRQLVHGAAVGVGDAALLLTGRGGSGKSTSALAALAAGLDYLGDDYVVCELDGAGAGARVHSLYNSAKVDAGGLRLLPRLAAAVDLPAAAGEDKSVLFTVRSFPAQLRASAALRAIVLPTLEPGPAGPQPVPGAQAFLALAPTTLFQLPGAGREATALLRDLVTRLPCYRLHLTPDPAQVVEGLRAALAAAG